MSGVNIQAGEDLQLLSAEGHASGSQSTLQPRCSRAPGILMAVLALIVAALACVHAGHFARRASPYSGTSLAEDGIMPPSQLQDPQGRCLEPQKYENRIVLILTACRDNATEQLFTVDTNVGLIQQRDNSGTTWCVTQETFFSPNGRALWLEKCLPGYHLQRIVGMCLHSDTPKNGTWAFAQPCDPSMWTPKLGVNLFCFMAVLPDSGEVALMENAKARKASIFACEESKVYWSQSTGMNYNGAGESFTANAGVFLNLWLNVLEDKLYKSHDWTVKVDPDTCWMPQRLRDRLPALDTHIHERVYVLNSYQSFHFLGAIEIFSQQAIVRLADRHLWCPTFDSEGEDGWIKSCMDGQNVSAKEDLHLLNSRREIDDCSDTSFAAFHFFKTPDVWNQCFDKMQWR